MSSSEGADAPEAELATPPQFELRCIYDDTTNPTELTIFSPGSENVTEWLTADRSVAVPLDRVV